MSYFQFTAVLMLALGLCFSAKSTPIDQNVTDDQKRGSLTYYVDGSVADDSGDGSEINPKKYITSGLTLMSAGDTLIIKDGVYTGQNNIIGDFALPRVYPPSGLGAAAYTKIQAENLGGVIIDGQYNWAAFSNVNNDQINHLLISGIHFRRGSCGVFTLKGDFNKVLKSGFEDGIPESSDAECPIASIAGGSSYSLVEDSWVWGKGRYGLYTSSPFGGTDHIVFRRVVVRMDDVPFDRVTCGIQFYQADTNVCQNCIVVDSKPADSVTKIWGAFCTTALGGTLTPDNSFVGSIALANEQYDGMYPSATTGNTTIENMVLWDNEGKGIGTTQLSEGTFNLGHITAGNNGDHAYRSNLGYPSTTQVKDSIAVDNNGNAFNYIDVVDDVNLFGNSGVDCAGCSITNAIETDPLVPADGFASAALKYLVRIEPDSNLKNVASDGGDIGATILKRLGVSGTLYGEDGWDQLTGTDLWPWADESIWAGKMRAYQANGVNGNRGFVESGNGLYGGPRTLTSYVWEYLGFPCPEGVCTPLPDLIFYGGFD